MVHSVDLAGQLVTDPVHRIAATVTRKVGGTDMRTTMSRLASDISKKLQLAGDGGIVTVTISAHVPVQQAMSTELQTVPE